MGVLKYEDEVIQKTLLGIFIHQMGGQTNRISISRGLHFVRQNLCERLQEYGPEEEVDYFFSKENEPNQNFYELMEFWEIAKDSVPILNQRDKRKYASIFELIYEMDGHYHYFQYEKLIAHMGEQIEKNMEELCLQIEEIYNNKFIKFLDLEMTERCQISLRRFEKNIGEFEYTFTKLWLANTMIHGGIAVVVAGSEGLTPKRLHGYKLQGDGWKVYPTQKLELYREMLLADNPDVSRFGELRGWK